uniref:Uncharacterized protein n=1 Tax=Glossina morsitans morsitans TaxID=37546 RepID=A0A1B0GFY5_GLOMM
MLNHCLSLSPSPFFCLPLSLSCCAYCASLLNELCLLRTESMLFSFFFIMFNITTLCYLYVNTRNSNFLPAFFLYV